MRYLMIAIKYIVFFWVAFAVISFCTWRFDWYLDIQVMNTGKRAIILLLYHFLFFVFYGAIEVINDFC